MNTLDKTPGFLVVMVDWEAGGVLTAIGGTRVEADAHRVASECQLADADAVAYVVPFSAFAR